MSDRVISPEERIENVRRALAAALSKSPRWPGRNWEIASASAQLAELEDLHRRGLLKPLPDDGLPF